MKIKYAIACLCAASSVDIASSSAQPTQPGDQDLARVEREQADRLRGSRLVGSADSLAIETTDGQRIPIARGSGCAPPVSRGGLIQVSCSLNDGPTYYFDESTRTVVESCGFWFAEARRCPPRQWPIEMTGCDGAVPRGIEGRWRLHALPGATGFYPVTAGWAMTLADGSMSFDVYGLPPLQRSYTIVESSDRRYVLQIRDARSASTSIDVELAPCGMVVEADGVCDAFCENFAREIGTPTREQERAMLARSLGGNVDEATLDRMLDDLVRARQLQQPLQRPEPVFAERAFFRAVASD